MPFSRQSIASSIDSKQAMKNKLFNEITKGRTHKIDDMSPEAKKAMLLTKLDAREVANTAHVNATPTTKEVKASGSKLNSHAASDTRTKVAMKNALVTGTSGQFRKPVSVSFDSGIKVTALSRSTPSHTAKTCFDNKDNHDNTGDNNNYNSNKPSFNTREFTTDDTIENDTDIADENNAANENEIDNTDAQTELSDKDCGENNPIIEEAPTNKDSLFPKSFVLALDKALEESCISRLRGDITDSSGISETGQVRALNGGRLANAQEVVVNVSHDDDKEILFHDDDEETLDTAKTISHIRVNIWMEYNQDFVPEEDEISELDYPTIGKDKDKTWIGKDKNKTKDSEENSHFLKVCHSEKKTPRYKATKPSTINVIPKNTRSGSSPIGKDSNNNTRSIGSSWSKSGTNYSYASSKNGSVFTEDSKKSNSCSKKSESGLRRISHK